MIALWLIAAHLTGDFILQTRWQASRKLHDPAIRGRHVLVYTLCFAPVIGYYTAVNGRSYWAAFACSVGLFALHYLTDSRRFTSTLGDWVAWKTSGAGEAYDVAERHGESLTGRDEGHPRLTPNPWTPIPILIDQTLHLMQLAALGTLFLT